MRYFELWLDESGDFEKDADKVRKGLNCSFVGGILTEKTTASDIDVNSLVREDFFHSCENKDKSEQFGIFRKLSESSCRFVVFNNEECIYTVDNNLTYQNIICEGIVKLLKELKSSYGEIHLDILIANRVDTTTGLDYSQSVVPLTAYTKAIESRLIMTGLKNGIDEKVRTIKTASARKEKRLMLSDIVCNTFLTRNSKAFGKEQREYINGVYENKEKTLIYNVFESSTEEIFYSLMSCGKLGEAVTALCQCDNEKIISRLMEIVKENIISMNRTDIEFQSEYIRLTAERFIRITREYDLCIRFIKNIDSYFLEIIRHLGHRWSDELYTKLHFDLTFRLFTLYTFRGETVNASLCEKECDSMLDDLRNDWDTILYSTTYELRKISALINRFEYEKAEEYADELIKKATEMKGLLEIISPDREIHLDILAKIYGTRTQIYSAMIRKDRNYYHSAVSDSDNAIAEFEGEFDKQRQYFYRVITESRYKDFEKAVYYLSMQYGLDKTDIKTLALSAATGGDFRLYSYLFLMASAAKENHPIAEEMYRAITPLREFRHHIDEPESPEHPYEVSLYMMAKYESSTGNKKSADKYFERTTEACFDHDDYWQWVIGLSACCEKYICSGDKNDLRRIRQIHNRITSCVNLPDGIKKLLNSLDTENPSEKNLIAFCETVL